MKTRKEYNTLAPLMPLLKESEMVGEFKIPFYLKHATAKNQTDEVFSLDFEDAKFHTSSRLPSKFKPISKPFK